MNEKLTAAELAHHLKVKTETIREWHRRGIIPAMRASRRPILFDLMQVEQALRERAERHHAMRYGEGM